MNTFLQTGLAPSRQLTALLLVAHGGAAACVLTTGLAPLSVLSVVLLLVLSAVRLIGSQALRRFPRSVREMRWAPDGVWTLTTRAGETRTATLLPQTYVHPLMVVLRFSTQRRGRVALVLLPDMMDTESFRRLRVRLRLAREAM